MKSEIRGLNEQLHEKEKKIKQMQGVMDKLRQMKSSQDGKYDLLETELSSTRMELEERRKSEKQAIQSCRQQEVRLNRALEELEKAKLNIRETEANQQGRDIARQDFDKAIRDNERLEKQKKELMTAFKKQIKLIDILKRQKIHMEAAKLLSFTEQEFTKTLELGS